MKKVLLGTPTFDGKEYCLDFWIKRVKQIQKETPCDILLIDNSKTDYYYNLIKNKYKLNVIKSKHYKKQPLKSLGEARKKLYEYAIHKNYDYIFSLEQDIFPPIDILKRLIETRLKIKDKEAIVGTPYIIHIITEEKIPYITKDSLTNVAIERIYSKKMKRKIQNNLTKKEVKRRKKLLEVYACGFGCTLIDVSILKKIKVKYTEKRRRPDDAFFYLDLFNQKINSYVNPTLMDKIIHIPGNSKNIRNWMND